tara:strand:+ start:6539 stop:6781 length:243 start_codon:yes stop_codon:yes gene_type:complete
MQQRAIDEDMVELLLEHGSCQYRAGAEVYCFDKASWCRICRERPCSAQRLEKLKNCYVVLVDGMLVTTGHRYTRFKRDVH